MKSQPDKFTCLLPLIEGAVALLCSIAPGCALIATGVAGDILAHNGLSPIKVRCAECRAVT